MKKATVCILVVIFAVLFISRHTFSAKVSLQKQLDSVGIGLEAISFDGVTAREADEVPKINKTPMNTATIEQDVKDLLENTFKTSVYNILELVPSTQNILLDSVKLPAGCQSFACLFNVAVMPDFINSDMPKLMDYVDIEGKVWLYGAVFVISKLDETDVNLSEDFFEFLFDGVMHLNSLDYAPSLDTLRGIFYGVPVSTIAYNLPESFTGIKATKANYKAVTNELTSNLQKTLKSNESVTSYAFRWFNSNSILTTVYCFALTSQNRIIGTIQDFDIDSTDYIYLFDGSQNLQRALLQVVWRFSTMGKVVSNSTYVDINFNGCDGVRAQFGTY